MPCSTGEFEGNSLLCTQSCASLNSTVISEQHTYVHYVAIIQCVADALHSTKLLLRMLL